MSEQEQVKQEAIQNAEKAVVTGNDPSQALTDTFQKAVDAKVSETQTKVDNASNPLTIQADLLAKIDAHSANKSLTPSERLKAIWVEIVTELHKLF